MTRPQEYPAPEYPAPEYPAPEYPTRKYPTRANPDFQSSGVFLTARAAPGVPR
jgi:hypothetical protein